MAVQAATVGDIVRYNDAPTRKRLRSALALAVVFWVLLIGSQAASLWSEGPDDHAPHAVATAAADEFAAVMDHPHFQEDSSVASPDSFVIARLPRGATTLVALGLVVAVVVVGLYGGGYLLSAAVRAPPPRLAPVTSGRQLLARFCISRR